MSSRSLTFGSRLFLAIALLAIASACKHEQPAVPTSAQLAGLDWQNIERQAHGTTVHFAMWAGDQARNRYFQGTVADQLKRQFDITLHIIPLGDTSEAVNKLLTEKGGGKTSGGGIDMLWINGENFRTAKQGSLLWGPFAASLPNIRYFRDQARDRDFGTPIGDMEAPWMRAQFVMAYDNARLSAPPRTLKDLEEWIKQHPGRFTYPAPPDFTGSVFIRHLLVACGGDARQFAANFDQQLYDKASRCAFDQLNEMRPYLWRKGETYPSSPSELDRLFANGEIDFSMNYGPSFASQHIARGDFPQTTRTFVFDQGTIGNHSYLAVPFNASNPAGALVVINFLMSPEHELDQMRVLGDIPPLVPERLSVQDRKDAESSIPGPATLSMSELQTHQLPEPDAEYTRRFQQDWAKKVLQQR